MRPTAGLPGELFCDRELPWQAIVRGHTLAALSAPPGRRRSAGNWPRSLSAALAETERA